MIWYRVMVELDACKIVVSSLLGAWRHRHFLFSRDENHLRWVSESETLTAAKNNFFFCALDDDVGRCCSDR